MEFAGDRYNEDALETLVGLLVEIRAELIDGDTSFLEAVASFYGGRESDEDEEDAGRPRPRRPPRSTP